MKNTNFKPKEVQADDYGQEVEVHVPADVWTVIDKMFGPQCSSRIRVKHDYETCSWVIEEENFNNMTWVERARFDAQEFYKDEYNQDEES